MGLLKLVGPSSQSVTSIAYDSRSVKEGTAFFCIKGENEDGHDYSFEALQNGASVIVGTNIAQMEEQSLASPSCTFLVVQDVRCALAYFSIHFYKKVDQCIQTIAVTGTNGKTTVAAFVRSLLTQLNVPTCSIGTNGIWTSTERLQIKKSTPTTPEAPDLHQIFQTLIEVGDKAAVMEVSSIAVDQKRVEGIHFDIAIHTNLSPEHLEYHQTFAHYKQAKMNLFKQARKAVVNIDDERMGCDLIRSFEGDLLTYSLQKNSKADVIATNCKVGSQGTSFELVVNQRSYFVHSSVYGEYNVANLLAAICVGLHNGFHVETMIPILMSIENPEGRFQIEHYMNRKIILDYAHTPVALANLVEETKKLEHRKLIVMIAGIGIRDFEKMPKMAETIEGKADEVVVSVDHPGFHDPKAIVDQVLTGFSNPNAPNIHTSLTREEGVLTSLALAEENDLVILTSGCINGTQFVNGEKIPHSDEQIIENYFIGENGYLDEECLEAFNIETPRLFL